MSNFTTVNSTAPPPSPAARPHNSGMSPLTAVLCLVAVVVLPMVSYTFFVAIKCPRNPFRWSRRREAAAAAARCKAESVEVACGVKYRKSAEDAAEIGDQCPVCLSAFSAGEEIRQLGACGHAFHAACVDVWLWSHASCPVCRAAVPVKKSKRASAVRDDDIRQGLPDAADLV